MQRKVEINFDCLSALLFDFFMQSIYYFIIIILHQKKIQNMSKYRGLVNEGSTCYLNSLLQTLFMTPQFRQNVYNYVHDERKISASDSIPYQLQKLFVILQLNQAAVYTKGLLKSFQWNEVDSFQQHDVQQFCRVLFEALQKASKGTNWIEKLYSGVMESFISCGAHPRSNQEIFMDISLPIKNQFTNMNCISIEQCLKQYLRPENLEDKINCQGCGQKVKVEKGMRLNTLPPILTLQINRFQLNYQTMQREKVNSFLYFPQILQMWRFVVPFQEIVLKGLPKDLYGKVKLIQKQKSARQTDFGSGLIVTGKKIERKKSFEIEAEKKQIKFYDEQNRDKRQDETKKLTPEQQKIKHLQILKDLKADKGKFDKKQKKTEQKTEEKKENEKNPVVTFEDDMLFGSFMDGIDISGKSNVNQFEDIQISNETGKGKKGPKFQKTEAIFEHQQESFDPEKEYPHNTYILFSVLVHSGGAYGGHYYAYIFNGLDWYCFNDNSVRKATREQIRKYGHPSQQSSYGANAYLLFYREAKTFKNSVKEEIKIPEQLLEKVRNDKIPLNQPSKTQKDYQNVKNRYNQIQNSVIFKIKYQSKQFETLVIPDRYAQTLESLRKLLKESVNIKEDDKNWRLRRYNKSQDTMHQVYETVQNGGNFPSGKNLNQIGLRETCYVAIQCKTEDEKFAEYDPKNIFVKLNVWREGLTLLTETHLKPIKIPIRQQNSFEQFYRKVQNTLKIKNPTIIKRNFSVGNPYQLYSLQANAEKTLISMRFFNGINLYVEQPTVEKLKWEKQFQDQKYKCQIKFNNPKEGQQKNIQIFIDTRKTLYDLKERISEIIGMNVEDFRIKKSQQAVSQMTTYKKRLVDLKFVNVEYLYIEQGRSSKGTVIIRKGFVSLIDDQIEFSLGQEFQLQIEGSLTTVADLKKKLGQKYHITQFNIRVRQFKSHQFGQVFRDSQSLLKIREKSLVWQQTQIEDPKGLQVYVRVFDLMTLQLGPLQQIFVEASGNYEQLALILEEQAQIQSDKLLVHKLNSNFVDKCLLFQCQWIQVRFIKKPIRDEPLYLTLDGEILIIKAAETAYHPKPNQKFIVNEHTQSGKGNKKEASLKITVVEQKEPIVQQKTVQLKIEEQKTQISQETQNILIESSNKVNQNIE